MAKKQLKINSLPVIIFLALVLGGLAYFVLFNKPHTSLYESATQAPVIKNNTGLNKASEDLDNTDVEELNADIDNEVDSE